MRSDEDLIRAEFESIYPEAPKWRSTRPGRMYDGAYLDLYEGFEDGYEAAIAACCALGWRTPKDAKGAPTETKEPHHD